jgi:hypothetical protein
MAAIHGRSKDLSKDEFAERAKFLTSKTISSVSLGDISEILYEYLASPETESNVDGLKEVKAKAGKFYDMAMSNLLLSFLNTLFIYKGKKEDLLEYAERFPETWEMVQAMLADGGNGGEA